MKSMSKMLFVAAAAIGLGMFTAGCGPEVTPEPFDANLRLTAGQVKTRVQVGKTTQMEIFKSLGAPNVVSIESGKGEIWTYDQIRVRRTSQGYVGGAFFGTGFGFGEPIHVNSRDVGNGAGVAGVDANASVGLNTTSVVTATLVIRFDANEKVSSYKMLVTSF